VGLGADPEEKNKAALFHAAIISDSDKVNEEMSQYKGIQVVSKVSQQMVMNNFYQEQC